MVLLRAHSIFQFVSMWVLFLDIAGKKILVTGADGFIGSHLVEFLVESGAHVRAFTYYNSFGSWGWLNQSVQLEEESLEIVSGDIRDAGFVRNTVDGVDIVLHLAALIGIPYSYSAPQSYIDTNVSGTLNILEAARHHSTSRVLVTSTSEVYGTALKVPITEDHPKQPQSPYSATKIAADCVAESFFRSFDLPVTIVRPFNTYGPRQSTRAFIPTVIMQLLKGEKVVKLGNLSPTRDLVFARDTAEGFARIALCESLVGKAVNIATENEVSMGDLANTIIEAVGVEAEIEIDPSRLRPSKSEVERLLGSAQLLVEHTGWKPETTLLEGLKTTVQWFKEHSSEYNFGTKGTYSV